MEVFEAIKTRRSIRRYKPDMVPDELLDKIDSIVYSGIGLDIDYYLEDCYDEDIVDEVYDYFMESETDDIDAAIDELGDKLQDELGDDYDENIFRLVRVKFLSEQANGKSC